MVFSFQDIIQWASDNPLMAGIVAIAVFYGILQIKKFIFGSSSTMLGQTFRNQGVARKGYYKAYKNKDSIFAFFSSTNVFIALIIFGGIFLFATNILETVGTLGSVGVGVLGAYLIWKVAKTPTQSWLILGALIAFFLFIMGGK